MKKLAVFWVVVLFVAIVAAPAMAKEMTDQEFVTKALYGGMFEVEAGQLAIERASNPEVKEFGRMMVSDHGKANAELRAIAETQDFEFPVEKGKKYEKMYQKLEKAEGKAFDREYMTMMVEDHKEDVKKFKKAEQKIENPELKAWASDTIPVLEKHLEKAESLKKQVTK